MFKKNLRLMSFSPFPSFLSFLLSFFLVYLFYLFCFCFVCLSMFKFACCLFAYKREKEGRSCTKESKNSFTLKKDVLKGFSEFFQWISFPLFFSCTVSPQCVFFFIFLLSTQRHHVL